MSTVASFNVSGLSCATDPPFRLVVGISSSVPASARYENVVYDLDPP